MSQGEGISGVGAVYSTVVGVYRGYIRGIRYSVYSRGPVVGIWGRGISGVVVGIGGRYSVYTGAIYGVYS